MKCDEDSVALSILKKKKKLTQTQNTRNCLIPEIKIHENKLCNFFNYVAKCFKGHNQFCNSKYDFRNFYLRTSLRKAARNI